MSAVPVTKLDLDQAMGELRTELRGEMAELRTELRGEMAELRTELRGEMAGLRVEMIAMKTELIHEIGQAGTHVANVMMEHIRTLISVVDEKYRDLPQKHAALRAEFENHATDRHLHARPKSSPPKRTRRSRG
jgi:hypothetical protein